MKLNEIKDVKSTKKKGIDYVCVLFSDKTNKDIMDFVKENKIPNPDTIEDNGGIHTTLIYSRKALVDNFKPRDKMNLKASFKGFKKFGENKQILVMEIDSPELEKRHKEIKEKHGGTHDFDSFIPHITLSTDAKDFDEKSLPDFDKPIQITREKKESL